jgi:hypothetical protein
MYRIDSDGNVAGHWSEGNPSTGQKGTKIAAAWLEAVQEELVAILTAVGLTPNKADSGQLATAIATKASLAYYNWSGAVIRQSGAVTLPVANHTGTGRWQITIPGLTDNALFQVTATDNGGAPRCVNAFSQGGVLYVEMNDLTNTPRDTFFQLALFAL